MVLSPSPDKENNKEVPMETSPKESHPATSSSSPKTPQNNSLDKESMEKQKQGSWGEQERTKKMRSSLEEERAITDKQGGAATWRWIDDGAGKNIYRHCGLNPNTDKSSKGRTKKVPEGSQNSQAQSQREEGTSIYSSIWELPKESSQPNLSKEGCSSLTAPGEETNSAKRNSGENMGEGADKPVSNDTDTNGMQTSKVLPTDEEGWTNVRYKRSQRKEQKQKPKLPEQAPPENEKERGRKRNKKKNVNAKSQEGKENSPLTKSEKAATETKSKNTSKLQQEAVTEQISLQERVNIALATAASREDRRSQSSSRQAYLTAEGTVVRNLQNRDSSSTKAGEKQTKQATQAKQPNQPKQPKQPTMSNQPRTKPADNSQTTRGRNEPKQQQ